MTDAQTPSDRPSADQIERAISETAQKAGERARRPAPGPTVSAVRRGVRHPLTAVAAALVLVAGIVLAWYGWTDPYEPDPQAATRDAVVVVDMVRRGVEAYAAEHGAYPETLAEIGLDDVGAAYSRDGSTFEVTAADGWGDVVGYRSTLGGTP